MDRASKTLRHKHRDVGHDSLSLIQMLIMFRPKYTTKQIMETWVTHRMLDGFISGIQAGMKKKNRGYGKKESAMEVIKKLNREITRL